MLTRHIIEVATLLILTSTSLAQELPMQFVTSADGTNIAYAEQGSGPPLIFVAGAFNDHTAGASLAKVLARNFTVITYDRRGRGQSSDAPDYTMQKEIEDIAALLTVIGEPPALLGFSSGAVLIMEGARQSLGFGKLILVEPPYLLDDSRPRPSKTSVLELKALVDAGERGAAVERFQAEYVGIPPEIIEQLRQAPFRPNLETIAHTTVYDATIVGDLSLDPELPEAIAQPVLIIAGTDSAPFLVETCKALADMVPNGRYAGIDDMNHDLTPALAPAIVKFLKQ
jgi:pimeloyl-ACP methyl ester carboxylesterase